MTPAEEAADLIDTLQAENARLAARIEEVEGDYSDALRMMKAGARMRREEWRPNKFVHVRDGIPGSLPYLEIVLLDGRRAPYNPSACDQFAKDWIDASEIARAALGKEAE